MASGPLSCPGLDMLVCFGRGRGVVGVGLLFKFVIAVRV